MNDLSYEARARGALGREDFRFSHRLGQNFILDDAVVDEIAARSGADAGDAVLEIGPGAGTLTAALLRRGIAIRSCENYPGLGPGWYRIAVRLHEENEALLETMRRVTEEANGI